MKTSGIYKIVNKVNGKYCVGSSSNISQRWGQHKGALQRNIHWNDKLQMGWNKYKEENFEFVIVEQCSPEKEVLLACEQKYLDIAKTEPKKCYNITFTAGKVDMTDAVRKKMSKAKLGKYIGDKNPAYKYISPEIIEEFKSVWVEGGRNVLIKYAKEKHSIGGTVICNRLIPEFKMDKMALAKRKENYTSLASMLYNKHCVFSGKSNVNYNPKKYKLIHEGGKSFCGTLNEFKSIYGFYIKTELINGNRKHQKGWSLINDLP